MVAEISCLASYGAALAAGAGIASYLLGAVPCGLLLARARGIDIRTTGSGNIGATNVFRSVGKGVGIVTLVLDAAKGFVPAFVFPRLLACGSDAGPSLGLAILCGCLAIAGHNWPVYLKFKGGKGIATSAGVLLAIVPAALGIAFVGWIVAFVVTRYVSVASISAAIVMVVAAWLLYRDASAWLPVVITILGLIAIWRHKSNIQRLREGTENRIDFRKRSTEE